ncbi:hypothetical protein CDAR_225821 [Caerostris darwini]|uniref:Uncharacterized protein n=1 Tax=Caerostris darwini TaxID=1538125 RepID=A0AAV4M4B7_9ARAC|nr:hypothetical protein CDAR_225821 [Caerostris darwini]
MDCIHALGPMKSRLHNGTQQLADKPQLRSPALCGGGPTGHAAPRQYGHATEHDPKLSTLCVRLPQSHAIRMKVELDGHRGIHMERENGSLRRRTAHSEGE